jgi:phage major head subunit gpT-like protein
VSALTATLKSEFWKAWEETAKPAPWEPFTTIIPSTTRIENYINAVPVPGMTEWFGHRNYAKVDSFVYSIRNKTYHNGFMAALEDVEDDQVGFLMSKPKELAIRAKKFPGRAVLKLLSQGDSTPAFDGAYFFADSHNFGTGDNKLTYTTADAGTASATHLNTYKICALYHGDSFLKPLIWQMREAPDLQTNGGTPQSKESRQIRWWCDMRGAPAFGFWWNAIQMSVTGLPTVVEMHDIFSAIEGAFRLFTLPMTISTEDAERPHEQSLLSTENLTMVTSTGLGEVMRQALTQSWVPQGVSGTTVATTNNYVGWANHLISAFLN